MKKITLAIILLISYANTSLAEIKSISKKIDDEQCYPSLNKRIMQSFFINGNTTWISYDNEKRDHQIVEKYIRKELVSTQNYLGESSVGHLDGIYVESDVIYATDKFTSPSIIKLQNQKIIKRIEYPINIRSNQVLAIDRENPQYFLLWASDSSNKKLIYKGTFDENKNSIIGLTPTKIEYPNSEVLQGLALDNNTAYALTGEPNKEIKLYLWDIQTGILLGTWEIPPYINKFGSEVKYEPEGLNIIKTNNGKGIFFGIALILENDQYLNCIIPFSID